MRAWGARESAEGAPLGPSYTAPRWARAGRHSETSVWTTTSASLVGGRDPEGGKGPGGDRIREVLRLSLG